MLCDGESFARKRKGSRFETSDTQTSSLFGVRPAACKLDPSQTHFMRADRDQNPTMSPLPYPRANKTYQLTTFPSTSERSQRAFRPVFRRSL